MEALFNRYRNVAVLAVAIVAQLMLLAYQIKSNGEVRLIRVWAVAAVTPVARAMEGSRVGVGHFLRDYFLLVGVRAENTRLKTDLDRARLENQFLHNELSTADRAKALAIFQEQTASHTVAAHVIGDTTGVGGRVVMVDRGSTSGIEKGMAAITPDGIVGKVTNVFPGAAYMLLITDPSFAAGVLSQTNRVHGTVKGQGSGTVMVDYIQNEQKVDAGEWFYTSGDDRIFPKGLPVGRVKVARDGKARKDVQLEPSGLANGLEEVLIVVDGVHRSLPDTVTDSQPVHLLDAPPAEGGSDVPVQTGARLTDADRLMDRYRKIEESQNHSFGDRGNGAPNFNGSAPATGGTGSPAAQQSSGSQPASGAQQLPGAQQSSGAQRAAGR
jgi:rod shape-determining protein MreC